MNSEATYNSLMDANNYTASDCQYNVSNFSCEKRTGPQIDLSKKGLGVFQTYYINDYNEELVIEKQNSVTLQKMFNLDIIFGRVARSLFHNANENY